MQINIPVHTAGNGHPGIAGGACDGRGGTSGGCGALVGVAGPLSQSLRPVLQAQQSVVSGAGPGGRLPV